MSGASEEFDDRRDDRRESRRSGKARRTHGRRKMGRNPSTERRGGLDRRGRSFGRRMRVSDAQLGQRRMLSVMTVPRIRPGTVVERARSTTDATASRLARWALRAIAIVLILALVHAWGAASMAELYLGARSEADWAHDMADQCLASARAVMFDATYAAFVVMETDSVLLEATSYAEMLAPPIRTAGR